MDGKEVPMRFQPPYRGWCGAACAQMIIEYHSERKPPLRRLVREIGCQDGVDELTLGLWLQRNGFAVRIVGWGDIFPASFVHLRADEIDEALRRWLRSRAKRRRRERRYVASRLAALLEAGGEFIPRPVWPRDLRSALKRDEPPIVALDYAPLYRDSGRDPSQPHFVVVTGLTGDSVSINDPYPDPGGRRVFPIEVFLHACYRLGGSTIFARPKG